MKAVNEFSLLIKCDAAINTECIHGNEQDKCALKEIEGYYCKREIDPKRPYAQDYGTIKDIAGKSLEPIEITSCWVFDPTEKAKEHLRKLIL